MQLRLTKSVYDKYKVESKTKSKKKFFPIIIISIIVIIVFCIYPRKNENWNKEYEIHFVIADYGENNNLNSIVENVENRGGAGVVSDIGEFKNAIIIFAYLNLNDAEKIYNDNKDLFINLCIKSKKIEKISKNLQEKIQNRYEINQIYNFYYTEKNNSYNQLIKHEKGESSIRELYNYSYNLRSKLLSLQNLLGVDDISNKINSSINKLILILDTFMKNNITGDYSALYFKKFYINLILEEIYLKTDIF